MTLRAEEGNETVEELADKAAKTKNELKESTETGKGCRSSRKTPAGNTRCDGRHRLIVMAVVASALETFNNSIMIRPISTLTRCAAILALTATALPLNTVAASAAPAGTNGGMTVPLRSILRACDFSPIRSGAAQTNATASSVIRATGGTVAAQVHLADAAAPGTHYEVRLIQWPRASNSPCDSAGPGVAVGGLDSDGAGQATSTLQDSIRPGTTGVWVFIQRPGQFSQAPAEYYTSDFTAPV
jgi:hypothetical protein